MATRKRFVIIVLTSALLTLGFIFLWKPRSKAKISESSNEGKNAEGHHQHLMKIAASTTHGEHEITATAKRTPSRTPSTPQSPSSLGKDSLEAGPSEAGPRQYLQGLQPMQHADTLYVSEAMSPELAEQTFLRYLNRIDVDCTHTEVVGERGDDGWNICVAGPYKPSPAKCIVYSFGINEESTMAVNMFRARGCLMRSVNQINCSGSSGGAGPGNNISVKTFGQHLRDFNEDNEIIDYLKIEFMEWEFLEAIVHEQSLPRVKQLALGVYIGELQTTTPNLTYYYSILEQLNKLGFQKWYSHKNTDEVYISSRSNLFVPSCLQMVFINKHYLLGPMTPLPPLKLDHSSPLSALPITCIRKSPTSSQAHGDTPPDVSFLPDAQIVTHILPQFEIIPLRAYDIPEANDDINHDLTSKYAASLLFNYIRTEQVRCPKSVRLGNEGDGGWDVCIAPPYNLKPNCLVYSFGIGFDWSFDDALVTEYQCDVYAFDHTINKGEHTRLQRIHFYPIGLGGAEQILTNRYRTIRTFKNHLEEYSHSRKVIDLVKIDIEHSEWQCLETMIHDGSLSNIKQLVMEIHTEELRKKKSVTSHFVYYWTIIRNLHKLGFRLWHSHFVHFGPFMQDFPPKQVSCCYELFFLNINFME